MKRLELIMIASLMFAVAAALAPATAQETTAPEAPSEADIEAGEAAAAEGEEAEREEEESNRRRRGPSESKIELEDEQSIRVTFTEWPLDGRDYPNLAELQPGEVMMITASAPPKLWTHTDLQFGDLTIPQGNVAENYPGVYGLWLRKTDDGWTLVFNNKPDVWGTMYDSKTDAGEITLDYAVTDAAGEAFAAEVVELEAGKGSLTLSWGEHQWSTSFTYGG